MGAGLKSAVSLVRSTPRHLLWDVDKRKDHALVFTLGRPSLNVQWGVELATTQCLRVAMIQYYAKGINLFPIKW